MSDVSIKTTTFFFLIFLCWLFSSYWDSYILNKGWLTLTIKMYSGIFRTKLHKPLYCKVIKTTKYDHGLWNNLKLNSQKSYELYSSSVVQCVEEGEVTSDRLQVQIKSWWCHIFCSLVGFCKKKIWKRTTKQTTIFYSFFFMNSLWW